MPKKQKSGPKIFTQYQQKKAQIKVKTKYQLNIMLIQLNINYFEYRQFFVSNNSYKTYAEGIGFTKAYAYEYKTAFITAQMNSKRKHKNLSFM